MMNREGDIRIHDTGVHFWEKHVPQGVFTVMLPALSKVLADMRRRGWKVHLYPGTASTSISRYNWDGKRGELEFHASASGVHFEIEFFQNVAFENRSGGRYDFNKLGRMTRVSRLLRLQCLTEMWRVVRIGESIGYRLADKNGFHQTRTGAGATLLDVRDLAELGDSRGTPLDIFNRNWGADRFERDETGWPSAREIPSCWTQHDRDGNQITQGVTKYLRDRGGRLVRGQVFGGINGNWQLVSNGRTIAWSHNAREFFDCDHPELEPRRVKNQKKRLQEELAKAVKSENYGRVATIGAVLARVA